MPVVRRQDGAIHRIVIFSPVVKMLECNKTTNCQDLIKDIPVVLSSFRTTGLCITIRTWKRYLAKIHSSIIGFESSRKGLFLRSMRNNIIRKRLDWLTTEHLIFFLGYKKIKRNDKIQFKHIFHVAFRLGWRLINKKDKMITLIISSIYLFKRIHSLWSANSSQWNRHD